MDEDENNNKIQSSWNTEEALRQKIIETIFTAVEHNSAGRLKNSFETLKSVRSFIVSFNYNNKELLETLENILTDYFDNLKNATPNRKSLVMMRDKQQYELNKLIDDYRAEIVKAFTELDLWLKVKTTRLDFDKVISEETFNSDLTLIKDKEKDLETLNTKELLNLLTIKQKHDAHAKYLYIKNTREE